jgi:cellulose synthase/poly-beta-1,6-N-acetylglucosamine synthase-like glycosyltransferase
VGQARMSTALLILGVLLVLLALHPFVTYPLSLLALARLRPVPVAETGRVPPGGVALCVCAYNEASVIRAKIENMLAMRRAVPDLEILVYVDASTDRTAEIARDFGEQVTVVVGTTRLGKTHGMNTLVAMSRADFLVFTDANVIFDAEALPMLLAPFADLAVGCVCGHLVYTSRTGGPTAETGSLYWRLEETIKELESRTGSAMGADGSIFAIRRSLHRPPPPDLCDDMFISMAVLLQGSRVVRAAGAYALEEAAATPGDEFARKIRIGCMGFNVHRLLRSELRRMSLLDRYKYVSHKLLRWLTAYLLAAGGLCILAGLALAEAWLLLAVLVADALAVGLLVLLLPSGPIARLREVLSAFVATAIGVWRSLRGERFQTWTPVTSARGPGGGDA